MNLKFNILWSLFLPLCFAVSSCSLTSKSLDEDENIKPLNIEIKKEKITSNEIKKKAWRSVYKKHIKALVVKHKPEYLNCQKDAMSKNLKTVGKIIIQWEITASGKVSWAKIIKSSEQDLEFLNCLLDIVKKYKFSPMIDDYYKYVITFPFRFNFIKK